jgi:hypothetical protein
MCRIPHFELTGLPNLPKKNRTRGASDLAVGSPTVESAITTIRDLWTAVERANEEERAPLREDITLSIDRLKRRIENRLGKLLAKDARKQMLFDRVEQLGSSKMEAAESPSVPRFPEPILRVCAKDLADHALAHLPQAAKYHSVEEFRNYLDGTLRFNSEATRRRSANYIVSRFFPSGVYNDDLPQFARVTDRKPALGEALFYLTCRAEKIASLVAEEIVFPSLAQGGVGRNRIREYVQSKFPDSKSANDVSQSIVRTYEVYGIGNASRTHLNVSLREGWLPSFAYILHLEFSEPGMHTFESMLDGPMHKWLLWDRQWMVKQLYLLREAGLLSKVSEIDRMRQFTTKYNLPEAVRRIAGLVEGAPQ